MPVAALHLSKLHTSGELAASEAHTDRSRETPNANPLKTNQRILDANPALNLETLIRNQVGNNGGRKIRVNAVLCVEMLLSASPEYFRPTTPDRPGEWQEDRMTHWRDATTQWLTQTYGDRVVRAELHLDESTPHIHAYLVPLDDRGRLNCNAFLGNRTQMIQLQDSYAAAMQPLGIERGIRGSRATHERIKDYYAAVQQEPDRSLTQQQIDHQLADRRRILKKNKELEATARALSQENEKLRQQLIEQRQQTQHWRSLYQAQISQLRDIPLQQIAYGLGLEPDSNRRRWHNDHHQLVITGTKFYAPTVAKGGGGAIDLVMHIEQCSFTEAIQWLSNHHGKTAALSLVQQQATQVLEEHPDQPFLLPTPEPLQWQPLREYLRHQLNIPAPLVDQLHQEGIVYSHKGALVAVRRSLEGEVNGASIFHLPDLKAVLVENSRLTQGWFHFTRGGKPEQEVQQIVVTQSAIEAMAYCTLNPPRQKNLYLSTDDSTSIPQLLKGQDTSMVIAMERSERGRAISQLIQQDYPQAVIVEPIQAADWVQELDQTLMELQQRLRAGVESLTGQER